MSKTPVARSVDVNVRVASHLSKVPSIATDASTSNLILLSVGVISKTGTPAGACARGAEENKTDARHKIAIRIGKTSLARNSSRRYASIDTVKTNREPDNRIRKLAHWTPDPLGLIAVSGEVIGVKIGE